MDGEVPFEQLFPELQLTHTQGRKTIERISPDTNLFYLRLWVHTTLRDVFRFFFSSFFSSFLSSVTACQKT